MNNGGFAPFDPQSNPEPMQGGGFKPEAPAPQAVTKEEPAKESE